MSSMQGFRPEMEDDHVMAVIPSCPSHVFLAVFDGHGGSSAAHYSAKNIISVLESTQEWKDYVDKGMSQKKLHDAFIATMRKIDVDMRKVQEAHEDDAFGGCTAVTAIISPSFFVCANAGDSRCVLGNRNYVIPMSRDHKPSDYEERKRVEAAGGSIILDRIEGSLAVARGLGDFEFKRRRDLDQACQMVRTQSVLLIVVQCVICGWFGLKSFCSIVLLCRSLAFLKSKWKNAENLMTLPSWPVMDYGMSCPMKKQ